MLSDTGPLRVIAGSLARLSVCALPSVRPGLYLWAEGDLLHSLRKRYKKQKANAGECLETIDLDLEILLSMLWPILYS